MREKTIKINKHIFNACQYSVNIDDDSDLRIMNFISPLLQIPHDRDVYKVAIDLKYHDLTKGKYWISFSIGEKDFSKGIRNYDALYHVLSFEVKYMKKEGRIEYTTWSKNWGAITHSARFVDVKIL